MCGSKSPGTERLSAPARSAVRFSKSCSRPGCPAGTQCQRDYSLETQIKPFHAGPGFFGVRRVRCSAQWWEVSTRSQACLVVLALVAPACSSSSSSSTQSDGGRSSDAVSEASSQPEGAAGGGDDAAGSAAPDGSGDDGPTVCNTLVNSGQPVTAMQVASDPPAAQGVRPPTARTCSPARRSTPAPAELPAPRAPRAPRSRSRAAPSRCPRTRAPHEHLRPDHDRHDVHGRGRVPAPGRRADGLVHGDGHHLRGVDRSDRVRRRRPDDGRDLHQAVTALAFAGGRVSRSSSRRGRTHAEDGRRETRRGRCAGFKAGGGNGHHFQNRSSEEAVLLSSARAATNHVSIHIT